VSGVIAGTRTPPVSLTLPSPLDSPGVQPMVPSEFPIAASTTTQFPKRFRTKMSFEKFDVSCERFEGKHTFAAPDRSYRIIANVRTTSKETVFESNVATNRDTFSQQPSVSRKLDISTVNGSSFTAKMNLISN
jgi:hypothetical protein